MQAQVKKRKPDKVVTRDAMKYTCAYRQVYCHGHTITEELAKFPALALRTFVSNNF
jgi:hypothetical protein